MILSKKLFVLCWIFIILTISLGESLKLSTLSERAKRTLHSSERVISVDLVDTNSTVYAASVFLTINVPFDPAARAILAFDNWNKMFKNITLMKQIRDTTNRKDTSIIYYAEAKYAMVRGWGMGVLDTVVLRPHQSLFVKVHPASSALVKSYKKERRETIKYSVSKLFVEGNLIKINEKQCRMGIFAWAGTNKPMPTWLIDALMKIVMPKFVSDFEKHVHLQLKREQK